MDLQVPEMNGPEVIVAMRAALGARMPPVVFITGADACMTKDIAEPVLSKPVAVDALLEVVRRHYPPRLAAVT